MLTKESINIPVSRFAQNGINTAFRRFTADYRKFNVINYAIFMNQLLHMKKYATRVMFDKYWNIKDRARFERGEKVKFSSVNFEWAQETPYPMLRLVGKTTTDHTVIISLTKRCTCPDYNLNKAPACKHQLALFRMVLDFVPEHV